MRLTVSFALLVSGIVVTLLTGVLARGRDGFPAPPYVVLSTSSPNGENCQLVRLLPETGHLKNFATGESFCSLVYPATDEWLYYITDENADGSRLTHLHRVDLNVQHPARVVKNIAGSYAALAPDNRYLIYSQQQADAADYFSAQLDGSDPRSLTAWCTAAGMEIVESILPQVSGDSQQAFFSGVAPDGLLALCGVALDGSNGQILAPLDEENPYTRNIWAAHPDWIVTTADDAARWYKVRPDGTEFAPLSTHLDATNQLQIASAQAGVLIFSDGDFPQKLIGIEIETGEILWELDGIQSYDTYFGRESIGVVLNNGQLGRRHVSEGDWAWYGSIGPDNGAQEIDEMWGWTPDAEWVWFIRDIRTTHRHDLVRMRRDTGEAQIMLAYTPHLEFVSWSPDGEWVVYRHPRTSALYRMRVDGSPPERLTPDYTDYQFRMWLPLAKNDGQWGLLAGGGFLLAAGGTFTITRRRKI